MAKDNPTYEGLAFGGAKTGFELIVYQCKCGTYMGFDWSAAHRYHLLGLELTQVCPVCTHPVTVDYKEVEND